MNAIIPPLALERSALHSSIWYEGALHRGLVKFGAMNDDMRNYMRAAVIAKCNMLVMVVRVQ